MDVYVGLLGSINDNCVLQKFSLYKQTQYNTDHFSTLKMVHMMVFSFGVSLVQLVDGPI